MKLRYAILTTVTAFTLNHAAIGQTIFGVGEPTGTIRHDNYVHGAGFEFYTPSGTGTAINSLGYWDQGGDGLMADHTVSIYAYAGSGSAYNLLATVTIPAGTGNTLLGGYRWASIGNIILPDNGQNGGYYAILASHSSLDPWTDGIGGSPILNPLIGTISGYGLIDELSGQTITQTSVNLVGNGNPASVYGGANLAFIEPVPEPATCSLLGAAAMLLIAGRTKK